MFAEGTCDLCVFTRYVINNSISRETKFVIEARLATNTTPTTTKDRCKQILKKRNVNYY